MFSRGALEAFGIPAGEDCAPEKHEMAERVLGFHADFCPVARTIGGCVAITTSLDLEEA